MIVCGSIGVCACGSEIKYMWTCETMHECVKQANVCTCKAVHEYVRPCACKIVHECEVIQCETVCECECSDCMCVRNSGEWDFRCAWETVMNFCMCM